jgi:tetratricopeptide (TPR) repeat protein
VHEGKLADAEADARKAIAGGHYFDVLGTVLFGEGKWTEALAVYQKNLALIEGDHGTSHPLVSRALERVANTLERMGKHVEALAMYERAIAIVGDRDSAALGELLDNSGTTLLSLGKNAEAEARFRRSVAIHEHVQGPDHPDVATTLVNLANTLDREGRDSLDLRQRALKIFEAKLGPDHPLVAQTVVSIGWHYVATHQPALALPYLERGLAIQEKRLGKAHPTYAYTLSVLGSAQLDAHEPAKAVVTLQAALDAPGTDPSARVDLDFNLADAIWQSHGDRAKARAAAEAALALTTDAPGQAEIKHWLATH